MQAFRPRCFFLQLPQPPSFYSDLSLLTYQSICHSHISHHVYFQTSQQISHHSYLRPSQQTLHNQSCHTTVHPTGTPPAPTTTSTSNKANDTVVPTGNGTRTTAGPSTSPPQDSTDTRWSQIGTLGGGTLLVDTRLSVWSLGGRTESEARHTRMMGGLSTTSQEVVLHQARVALNHELQSQPIGGVRHQQINMWRHEDLPMRDGSRREWVSHQGRGITTTIQKTTCALDLSVSLPG